MVQCASCKSEVPESTADVVAFGTGYRCAACSARAEIHAHHARSDAAWQKQDEWMTGRFWIRVGVGTALFLVLFVVLAIQMC